MRAADGVRAADVDMRSRALRGAARELDDKICIIKVAATRGATAQVSEQQTNLIELGELQALVNAAEEDVVRIEERFGDPAGAELSVDALRDLASSLERRLESIGGDALAAEAARVAAAARKHAAMQEVALRLVPQMHATQTSTDEKRASLERQLDMADDAAHARCVAALEEVELAHEIKLAELEARAAQALASLEQQFEEEVVTLSTTLASSDSERERIETRLAGVYARIQALEFVPVSVGGTCKMAGGVRVAPCARGARQLTGVERHAMAVSVGPLTTAGTREKQRWIFERLAYAFAATRTEP